MNVRGVPISALLTGLVTYARRRLRPPPRYFSSLLTEASGTRDLSDRQRDRARGIDGMLRRLGVRCLWRAAIVTETLRREGVAARIRLSVSASDPRKAHAECEVGGQALRSTGDDMVTLR
jgi:hypothetical protein